MGNTSDYNQNGSAERPSEHINLGILAHVDAGKTTLSEGMLYLSGAIRDMGRVDYRNCLLYTSQCAWKLSVKWQTLIWSVKRKFLLLWFAGHMILKMIEILAGYLCMRKGVFP